MRDFATDELLASDDWRRVLEAYDRPQRKRNPQQAADDEQWLPRVARVEGVDSTQLSRLHGNLIALGLLKFEIAGKIGMKYQLTPLGRQTLEHGLRANLEMEVEPLTAALDEPERST